jgi:hypothetical protein
LTFDFCTFVTYKRYRCEWLKAQVMKFEAPQAETGRDKPQIRQPTKWPEHPPRPEPLLAVIRRLAKERRISYLDHSEERIGQRGFDVFDVRRTLERGHIVGRIEAGKKEGEWKVKVVETPEGASRKMGVVTIVVREQRLLIKTTEWEDK